MDLRFIRRHGDRWRVEKSVNARYIKRSFDSLDAAIAFRDELLARIERERRYGESVADGRLRVGDLVDLWFNGPPDAPHRGFRNRKHKPLSPGTVKDFEWRIGKHVALIADRSVRELLDDPFILERLLTDDLTPANARKTFTILNLAFKAAMRGRLGPDRRIPANPCAVQQLPPADTAARGIPTEPDVEKLLLAASREGAAWDLFCRLTVTLGTRRGETCALRIDDLDPARRQVHIDEAACIAPGGSLRLKPPKSWESRTLHIPHPGFWAAISPIVISGEPRSFLFEGWVRDAEVRSARPGPKCWHPSSASHRFAKIVASTGLVARDTGRPYTLHSLRQYVATTLYNRSHDWVQVARFLGHKDPSITIRLYANHVVDESQRALGSLAAAPWWGPGDALSGSRALS